MKIHRLDARTVALEELDVFICELLRQIPKSADPGGSRTARARLFPSPTDGVEPEADAEWREYVEPGLRDLFREAVDVVRDDLKQLPAKEPPTLSTLRLPVRNLDAWVHALNQARLAMTARHGFTERELEREIPIEGNPRAFALFQVHFYGLLQEFFLRQLEE
jgi:hypothetical protein